MKKFSEFAQVDEARKPSSMTPEYMHNLISEKLRSLMVDRSVISKMPAASSKEWYEAYEKGTMIQLTKYMVVPPKNLGHMAFLYEIFSCGVNVGGSEEGAVVHLDIKFEYKRGGSNGTDWVERYNPNTNKWTVG